MRDDGDHCHEGKYFILEMSRRSGSWEPDLREYAIILMIARFDFIEPTDA